MSPSAEARVFISYSRKDRRVATALFQALEARGFDVVLDLTDIQPGEDWRIRLGTLILGSDTVVFVVSPDSVSSPICGWEVEEAERLEKRVLPVVACPVDDAAVPEGLRRLNFIFLEDDAFEKGVALLDEALRTDLAWLREHTRIGELAAVWASGGERMTDTLRGPALAAAERWRDNRPRSAPELTALHQRFLAAGRRGAIKRQRWGIAAATAVAILSTGLAVLAEFQRREAQEQRKAAVDQQAIAEQNERRALRESRISNARAETALAELVLPDNPREAMDRALSANAAIAELSEADANQVHATLARIHAGAREMPSRWGYTHHAYRPTYLTAMAVQEQDLASAAGEAAGGSTGARRLQVLAGADLSYVTDQNFRPVSPPIGGPDGRHGYARAAAWVGPDSFVLASGWFDPNNKPLHAALKVYGVDGQLRRTLLANHPMPVTAVQAIPRNGEGPLILAGDAAGDLWLATLDPANRPLRVPTGVGREIRAIGYGYSGFFVVFAGQGERLSTAGHVLPFDLSAAAKAIAQAQGFKLDTRPVAVAAGLAEATPCFDLDINSRGAFGAPLAMCEADGWVSLYTLDHQGKVTRRRFRAHGDSITAIARRPDGNGFATAGASGEFKLWLHTDEPYAVFHGPKEGKADFLAFSQDHQVLISSGRNEATRFWNTADFARFSEEGNGDAANYQWLLRLPETSLATQPNLDALPSGHRERLLVRHEGGASVFAAGAQHLIRINLQDDSKTSWPMPDGERLETLSVTGDTACLVLADERKSDTANSDRPLRVAMMSLSSGNILHSADLPAGFPNYSSVRALPQTGGVACLVAQWDLAPKLARFALLEPDGQWRWSEPFFGPQGQSFTAVLLSTPLGDRIPVVGSVEHGESFSVLRWLDLPTLRLGSPQTILAGSTEAIESAETTLTLVVRTSATSEQRSILQLDATGKQVQPRIRIKTSVRQLHAREGELRLLDFGKRTSLAISRRVLAERIARLRDELATRDEVEAHLQAALRDTLEKRWPAATENLRAAARTKPDDAAVLHQLARSLSGQEWHEVYARAVALDPYAPYTLLNRGIWLARMNRREETVKLFSMILALPLTMRPVNDPRLPERPFIAIAWQSGINFATDVRVRRLHAEAFVGPQRNWKQIEEDFLALRAIGLRTPQVFELGAVAAEYFQRPADALERLDAALAAMKEGFVFHYADDLDPWRNGKAARPLALLTLSHSRVRILLDLSRRDEARQELTRARGYLAQARAAGGTAEHETRDLQQWEVKLSEVEARLPP